MRISTSKQGKSIKQKGGKNITAIIDKNMIVQKAHLQKEI